MNSREIGKKLKELRGSRTMEEVAQACEVTRGALSNYENGWRVPSDEIKAKLASYYNVTVGELFFDE